LAVVAADFSAAALYNFAELVLMAPSFGARTAAIEPAPVIAAAPARTEPQRTLRRLVLTSPGLLDLVMFPSMGLNVERALAFGGTRPAKKSAGTSVSPTAMVITMPMA